MINLNILDFVIDTKYKLKDFSKKFQSILGAKIHKFKIDGKYLKDNGMQEGVKMGKVLKRVEEEWISNDFKISKNQIQQIIQHYTN